jgi:hypothetical protein
MRRELIEKEDVTINIKNEKKMSPKSKEARRIARRIRTINEAIKRITVKQDAIFLALEDSRHDKLHKDFNRQLEHLKREKEDLTKNGEK